MKLRTSFFNPTVFRKNLTRFAPAWTLYGVMMLLVVMVMLSSGGDDLDFELIPMLLPLSIANFLFALLTAQLLLGDLYQSRMCNALHALPLRREGWFLTNLASGMCFSLIPTGILLVLCLGILSLGGSSLTNGALVPVMIFAGANLQYLFFFGLAVLCAFLVGSRFAMALVYGILNFGSLIAYWLVDTLYTPLLYGLKTQFAPFLVFSPVGQMLNFEYMDAQVLITTPTGKQELVLVEGWGYLGVCAAIGLVLMGLALLLYRRRKLECAGDFLAVKAMEPVFLVLYSLAAGAVLQLFFALFTGNDGQFFLYAGLAVGFFTGRMLLRRSVRVFQWKAWLACLGLLLGVGLSLLITALDPLGIQSWMPKVQDVARVEVTANHVGYRSSGEYFQVEEPEDIQALLDAHGLEIQYHFEGRELPDDGVYHRFDPSYPITLKYTLKNGTTVNRYYTIVCRSEAGLILKDYFNTMECILGYSSFDDLLRHTRTCYASGQEVYGTDRRALAEALEADFREGNLIQIWGYRDSTLDGDTIRYVEFELQDSGHYRWVSLEIPEACRHTLQWLEENGYQEKY